MTFIVPRTANLLQIMAPSRFPGHLDAHTKAVLEEAFADVQATLVRSTTPIFHPHTRARIDTAPVSVYQIFPKQGRFAVYLDTSSSCAA